VLIADGHADSLMWNRDLNRPQAKGHLDFPRLLKAQVAIQCLTVVTQGFPYVNGFRLFARWRGWPKGAARTPWSSALWQMEQLHQLCKGSGGKVALAASSRELTQNLEAKRLSVVLGMEGGAPLEEDPSRVRALHEKGVRFIGPVHLSNNLLGGSSFPGMGNRPLTPLGRAVLDEMASLSMPVDVAHASPRTLQDILSHRRICPFSSHTGVSGAKKMWRNLPDGALKVIADSGGMVGIIFANVYLGGRRIADIVRHIEHAVSVMGEDAVGLGSDFDGMVAIPKEIRDVGDISRVADALSARGHGGRRIEKILGANWRRFWGAQLG
jgi:membrane dipeptidase